MVGKSTTGGYHEPLSDLVTTMQQMNAKKMHPRAEFTRLDALADQIARGILGHPDCDQLHRMLVYALVASMEMIRRILIDEALAGGDEPAVPPDTHSET